MPLADALFRDWVVPQRSPKEARSSAVAEEIARVCATTQQVSGANELFAWPLLLGGSEEQRHRWLSSIAAGRALGAFALSEPEAGSDVVSMTTRATRTGDGWRLSGTKRWITNGGVADTYVVFAVTTPGSGSKGISAFVVDSRDAGVSFGAAERKMGLKGSPTTEMYLDEVTIPLDRLVGEPGQGLRFALALDRTRTAVAAQAVGIAQGALDVAVEHVCTRRQFGQRLAEFQGVQFMLADMAVAVRAARLLTHAAAQEIEAQTPTMGVSGAGRQALRLGHRDESDDRRRSAPRRLRIRQGLPRRTHDARREGNPDLRGNQPDPAHRHRPRPPH